jgi:hypothetical protein
MKITTRDAWRVSFTLKPYSLADLGIDGLGDITGQLLTEGTLELAVCPRRLGDFGAVSMGDRLLSSDISGDYERRCQAIAAELRKLRQVDDVEVHFEENHTCSHCHLSWEVLDAKDVDLYPHCMQDEHSAVGEPVCCEKAIAEFRAERGIPALAEAGDPR